MCDLKILNVLWKKKFSRNSETFFFHCAWWLWTSIILQNGNHKSLWFWKEKELVVEFKTSYSSLKIAQNRRKTQKRARKYWYRWKSIRTPWLQTSQLRWRWNGGGEKSTCQPREFRRPLMLWWRKQFWFQKSNLVLVPKVDFVFQRPQRNKHTLDWGKG